MIPTSRTIIIGLLVCVCLSTGPVLSHWEYAVTTPSEITFFDSNWTITTSAAHQFEQLSAITYDETNDIIYFNDQVHRNSTIFSLKLSQHRYNHQIEEILSKTKDEYVQGIAFDPLDRTLYWTDSTNNHIYSLELNKKDEPKILIKLEDSKSPQGIAIDVCRRKIYWTNSKYLNASIERSSMDGSEREILINTHISMPSGIVVDQFMKRLYWVDTFVGNKYTIESSSLDGTDRVKLVVNYYNRPSDLAVDENYVYWTDTMYNALWKVAKNQTGNQIPEKVYQFSSSPKGIIIESNLLLSQANNTDCRAVVHKIQSSVKSSVSSPPQPIAPELFCLNKGKFNYETGQCTCGVEFKGRHCEISVCYNYCIQGTCSVSSVGYPQCNCFEGFEGDRCEKDLCTGYCLNGGRCSIEAQSPICHCSSNYHGHRCESTNIINLCQEYCENGITESDDFNLDEMCGNCTGFKLNKLDSLRHHLSFGNDCNSGQINMTAVLITTGVVLSLLLTFLIVKTMRKHYAPLRPKIKKTFVVRKNVTKTPLTCRPTTEQCEITIENCCNMNICDTPCFDPKTLQQEISRKEDKRSLVDNMDGDLY